MVSVVAFVAASGVACQPGRTVTVDKVCVSVGHRPLSLHALSCTGILLTSVEDGSTATRDKSFIFHCVAPLSSDCFLSGREKHKLLVY